MPRFHLNPRKASHREWLSEFALTDGPTVRFRRVRAEDEPLIAAAINSSSRETLLHRFFSPIRSIAPDQLRRMLEFDVTRETCIVGVLDAHSGRRIVCGARYVKLSRPRAAEIALTVHDDFQHRGLGSRLLRLLAQLAWAEQVEWFEARSVEHESEDAEPRPQARARAGQGHLDG